jgi:hypothetical protein
MSKTILVLAANPKNTPSLRLDQEVREIDNGLQRAQKRDDFVLKAKFASRPVDVRRAMLDYEPNIVHFCGHGGGQEGIAFEDEQGQAKLISTDAISGFFQLFSDKVECVVLNACYSDVQARAISEYIPFVVGMRKGIGDSAAIEFAVAFYDALGAGKTIDFAFKLACNAIQWAGLPEHLTPMIHVRADRQIGQVLPFESLENPRQKEDSLSLNMFVTGGIEVSQEVAQVAFMIGQCVVLRGHTLLSNGFAGVDKLCGEGAFTACRAQNLDANSRIRVFRPRRSPSPHFAFGSLQIVGNDYDERRNYVIYQSDVVVLLGGGDGTKQVARQAQIAGKPVIPVGIGADNEFAVQLWHRMNDKRIGDLPVTPIKPSYLHQIGPEQEDFDQVALSAVVVAEKLVKRASLH